MAVDTALIFNIIAKDHTRKTFDRVGIAAKAAFAAAGFGVAMFAKQSIAAYADAEKQQARLEGAYKRFPKVADVSIDSLRDMNSALQETTRFDDDAVAGAQALLAQFNLTGQQIKQVTPLLLDYAAATGKDVASAAESLGKAFLGQTRALKEVGISYKTTGDAGQDFANITDLLRQKVGGFAEEEGKTAAGQMEILNNKFGDLQENVGQALIPALTGLVDIAKPVLDTFNKLPAPMQTTVIAAAGLGAAALVAVPKIIAFREAMQTWGPGGIKANKGARLAAAGAKAVGAAMIASAAVNAFSKAQVNAGRTSTELAKALERVANGTQDNIGPAFTSFTGRAVDLDEALGLVRDNHWWDQLENGLASVLGTTSNFGMATESVNGLDEALSDMVSNGNADTAAKALDELGIGADEAARILPKYSAAVDDANSAAKGATPVIKGLTTKAEAQKRAVDALKDSWDLLSGLLDKRAAKRNWIDSMSEVTAKIKEAGGKFDESTAKGRDFQDWLDTTVGNLQNYAQGFKNPLKQQQVMNEGLDDIRRNLQKQGLSPAQVSKILGDFDKIKSKVVDLQKTAAKTVTLNIKPQITGNGRVVIAAAGGGRALLDVDYREVGGPVKAGQPYVVGEKRPELFVPKTDGTILPSVPSGAGGGLVVNIEHLHTEGDRLEESLPRAVRRTAFVLGMGAA